MNWRDFDRRRRLAFTEDTHMKIALFGARGTLGSRIAAEAERRGHRVTAVLRDTATAPAGATATRGDALDAASVARAVAGHDAVVSAIGLGPGSPPTLLSDAARALVDGLRAASVRRLVVVGGAGSLEIRPGLQVVDAPDFPAAWKPAALAHRDSLAVYRDAQLDWTYVSPPAFIAPGERTGRYRVGFDTLLTDERGESRISAEDYAIAIVDELERGAHPKKRITVAY
jgi:putative NADH-flavin reductase